MSPQVMQEEMYALKINFKQDKEVKFVVAPRFPVMGGWRYTWTQGYNLPTKFYLQYDEKDPSIFVFNNTFLYAYDDIIAENYTLTVVLPEGAQVKQVKKHLFNLFRFSFHSKLIKLKRQLLTAILTTLGVELH
jgi:hypothetical protein